MDNKLQEQLKVLKMGYLKKLEGMIPEFKVLLEKISLLNVDELYIKVHTISGTSGMYGLIKLSDLSTDFELYLKKVKNDKSCYDEGALKGLLTEYIEHIIDIIKGENGG